MTRYLLSLLSWLIVVSPNVYASLQATSFPKTYADTTFVERVKNETEGYKPFMDKKAYIELNIVPGEEIFTDHMIVTQEQSDKEEEQQVEKQPFVERRVEKQPLVEQYSSQNIGGGAVTINNQIVGGTCFPAAKDKNFKNKILTTGKYETVNPAFEKGLITIFRKEGKCGTIANDPCGYTCYGIGSSPKCSGVVIHSRAEAEDFYYNRYWQKYQIYKLPDVISTDILIACMASGPGTALAQFRVFLGLQSKSSKVDDEMVTAVKQYSGDIHNRWMDKRNAFLQDIAKRRYQGKTSRGYANAIELKRKNGCHVQPYEPLYR